MILSRPVVGNRNRNLVISYSKITLIIVIIFFLIWTFLDVFFLTQAPEIIEHKEDQFLTIETPTITKPPINHNIDKPVIKAKSSKIALLVLCFNRPKYLEKTLQSLLSLPEFHQFDAFLSQDGNDAILKPIISAFPQFVYMSHKRGVASGAKQVGSAYLAAHYKWAIDRILVHSNYSYVIICEDDMVFAPDFLSYFLATESLVEKDPSIWCVSSHNDVGLKTLASDDTRLFRTDYFSGLGWMLSRKIWHEIRDSWPIDQWDYFMRLDTTSKGRDCIVPEVARNHNIGKSGSNVRGGTFFSDYLDKIAFPSRVVDWSSVSLDYLLYDQYEKYMHDLVSSATYIGTNSGGLRSVPSVYQPDLVFLVTYNIQNFVQMSKMLHLTPNPRGVHKNTIIIRVHQNLVVLADKRMSPYLPEKLRISPKPGYIIVTGAKGASCNDVCKFNNAACLQEHFQYLNACSVLKKHFPCEMGCIGGVWGGDIPNYVNDTSKPDMNHRCLTTEQIPSCVSSHPTTMRLCPCISYDKA